jgi:hypothetical protein
MGLQRDIAKEHSGSVWLYSRTCTYIQDDIRISIEELAVEFLIPFGYLEILERENNEQALTSHSRFKTPSDADLAECCKTGLQF